MTMIGLLKRKGRRVHLFGGPDVGVRRLASKGKDMVTPQTLLPDVSSAGHVVFHGIQARPAQE